MPLYGNELGRDVTPFDAGLGRVVKLDKPGDFVGRAALAERARTPGERTLVGLVGKSRRVPRHGYSVLWEGEPCGTVTSGAPSPTLGRPIAMAYVTASAAGEAEAGGERRRRPARRGYPRHRRAGGDGNASVLQAAGRELTGSGRLARSFSDNKDLPG